MAASGPVDPSETWDERGHLPCLEFAHLVDQRDELLEDLYHQEQHVTLLLQELEQQSVGRASEDVLQETETCILLASNGRRLLQDQCALLQLDIDNHATSFDNVTRPSYHFPKAGRVDPLADWSESLFRQNTRFNKDSLQDVIAEMALLPANILTRHGCQCSMTTAVVIVLTRLATALTWDGLQQIFRVGRSHLIAVFTEARELLWRHYGVTVTQLDYSRIMRSLPEWDDTLQSAGAGHRDVVCFIDGKAWRWERPGQGEFFTDLAAQHGLRPDQVQRSFYNGHYSHHGGKVSCTTIGTS